MSYRKRFPKAFEAMLKEMGRHQPKYGDRWETREIPELIKDLKHAVNDCMIDTKQALDIANLAVIIYLRAREELNMKRNHFLSKFL